MVGTTVPSRAFGRFLKGLREQSGASLLAAGLAIDTSKQSILRLEGGQPTKISTPQLKSLLDLYRVGPTVYAQALELWNQVRQQAKTAKLDGTYKGWWQAYSDQYAPHFDHYLRLEAGANRLVSHQLVLVPGLLQTHAYRRALVGVQEPNLPAADIDRRLELTARRQERLEELDFHVEALLSEAVLMHQPGDRAVMVDQLRYLMEIGTSDNVTIRVVPFAASAHRGLGVQSFTLLGFPHLTINLVDPPIVYIDGAEGALYLERTDVIARFRQAIANMRRVALSENETRDLMSSRAKELQS